jgi:hypothetical protein
MKTIFTKSTGTITGNVKRVFTLSAVAAIAAVPFLSATQIAKADPPRHAPAWGYRDKNRRNDRYDRRNDRRNDRWDRRSRYESFTGTVTRTDGRNKFDLRVGGRTYNVYPNSSNRRIDRGDVVRVYGQRTGNNDIRNASVSIIRNR